MSHRSHRVVTTESSFVETAARAPEGARVPVEVRVAVSDPFRAYRRAREGVIDDGFSDSADGGLTDSVDDGLADSVDDSLTDSADDGFAGTERFGTTTDGVYLATTGGQSGWGYFAVDPVSRLQVGSEFASLGETGAAAGETFEAGNTTTTSTTLSELAELLEAETLVRGDCEVPYPCGAFGWLSYDVARELESLPDTTTNERNLPRLQLGVFDRVAAWEEPRSGEETTLRVTACPRVADDPQAAYERGRDSAVELVEAATGGDPRVGPPPVDRDSATFESDCSEAEFAERVRAVKQYVHDGDTFQANISQRLTAPAAVHPVEAYEALRRVNPAPYSALLEFPGVDLVSASPELLLHRDGDRLLTEPIAGTRPRGETAAEDAELERDLLSDEKERAEHAMLVDLERNDLGKVSRYGTVDVTEYRRVDRYSEVMHLVSLVEGEMADWADLGDAIAAVFPGGTITGAPKPRTMEIIDELETSRRGPYTGSIGVFGFDGRATLNIVIRTLVRRGDEYSLRVGAGIVHDSVPEREFQETLDKGRALVTALDDALGDRGRLSVAAETEVDEETEEGVAD